VYLKVSEFMFEVVKGALFIFLGKVISTKVSKKAYFIGGSIKIQNGTK
jgi:hypothetical protein